MKNVALLIETSNAYARGLLGGIIAYVREKRPWSVYFAEHGRGDVPLDALTKWRGDGIIARVETPAIAQVLRRVRVPIVDVSSARLIPALPWFETDDAAFAQLAYQHLQERGFKHFAFCGDARFNWSNWRQEQFEQAVKTGGGTLWTYQPARHLETDDSLQVQDIARWIKKLPRPLGVFTCYDLRGHQVLDACRHSGIAVPDEVAVIGVDNDPILCELSNPPLTSIIPNTHRTGYEAAMLLDALMAGRVSRGETHLIPPVGLAVRQSTDTLAIEDQHVARALRFIRENAIRGIDVSDVLKAVPQSRRLLEGRFKRALGRTPHDEIIRVQLNRVRELLTETDLPLSVVAERAGFAHVEYLSVVFKKKMGLPPSRYRALNRPGVALLSASR